MLPRCIVMGASAGGFEVLLGIVSRLPADLPAPVFVGLHIPAYQPSYLPSILSGTGNLRAIHPADDHRIEQGFIYVAPPDHHLLVDNGHVAVKRGPKENGFRPSIDALFRSAAYSYGTAAIGVLLSDALHDGTSGLWTIKRLGGTAIVQDPKEAEYASMPRRALEYVDADYRVRSTEISSLSVRLANESVGRETMELDRVEKDLVNRIATDVQIAAGTNVSQKTFLDLGELTSYTCPECHGVLIRIKEGTFSRFRCHTGHGFSEDVLLEAVMQSTGELIWQAARGLQETVMLLQHMGKHLQDAGESARAEKFYAKARELEIRAGHFQEHATHHESLSENRLDVSEEDDEE